MAVENFFLKFLFTKSQMCNLFFLKIQYVSCSVVRAVLTYLCSSYTFIYLPQIQIFIYDQYCLWLHTLFLTTERPSIGMLYKMLLYVPRFYFPYIWYNMLLYLCCTFLFSLLTYSKSWIRGYEVLLWLRNCWTNTGVPS